jgi:DNA-binding winged helix-turn-helix (wHTH) protein/tetratricopeptide (TPR) repeat protein
MGEPRHDGLAIPGRVVLAHELPFQLGSIHVTPATRQVEGGGRSVTVEPRVMQVLVALARAGGGIVTRDELIDRCWDGRIVSDDAINRVLSRLRQRASEFGGASFSVETIARVGYRLVEARPGSDVQPGKTRTAQHQAQLSRRAAIAGGVAAAAGIGAAGFVWRGWHWQRPDLEAVELYRRGDLAQRAGIPSQTRQATSYFERAVQIDPAYANAWGGLALAYTHSLDGFSEAEMASMPGRIRSAADRALKLDPDNADALLALACVKPFYRNWGESEAALQGLVRRFPDHWLCHGRLALLLYQVGRIDEGVRHHRRVIEIDPMIPGAYAFSASALSGAGRIQEADALLEEAHGRWPSHPLLWFSKYFHLVMGGRPKSAAAFVMDPESLPSGFVEAQVAPALALAKAVETNDPADVGPVIASALDSARSNSWAIPQTAAILALFGRFDQMFDALDRYLMNSGSFGTPDPIGPYVRRATDMLFTMPLADARADSRFARLLDRTGLESYWKATGTAPDYRRT